MSAESLLTNRQTQEAGDLIGRAYGAFRDALSQITGSLVGLLPRQAEQPLAAISPIEELISKGYARPLGETRSPKLNRDHLTYAEGDMNKVPMLLVVEMLDDPQISEDGRTTHKPAVTWLHNLSSLLRRNGMDLSRPISPENKIKSPYYIRTFEQLKKQLKDEKRTDEDFTDVAREAFVHGASADTERAGEWGELAASLEHLGIVNFGGNIESIMSSAWVNPADEQLAETLAEGYEDVRRSLREGS